MYFVFAGEEIGGCFTFSLLEFIVSFQYWESMRERERVFAFMCVSLLVYAVVTLVNVYVDLLVFARIAGTS